LLKVTDAQRGEKDPEAFRTISEVAEILDVPPHVLRFWETKFEQIEPLKRAGNRRFYRPEQVTLLHQIRHLLYEEGYTIKGVRRLLDEGRLLPDGTGQAGAERNAQAAATHSDASAQPETGEAGETVTVDAERSSGPDLAADEDSTADPAAATLPPTQRRALEALRDDLRRLHNELSQAVSS